MKQRTLNTLILLLMTLSTLYSGEYEWERRVYLATYPRSGNHWLRFLVEEASHIATSSVYQDYEHNFFSPPFPWGGYSTDHGYTGSCRYPIPGESVLLKTHYPVIAQHEFDNQPAIAKIRIIRHPVDSFYSYYLYLHNGKPEKRRIPLNQLSDFINSWRQFQEFWDTQTDVITIRYEDMYENPAFHLKLVLNILNYPHEEEDIMRALQRYPPTGGLLKHLHHFKKSDLKLIRTALGDLMARFGYEL
jgi:hypothetical protein